MTKSYKIMLVTLILLSVTLFAEDRTISGVVKSSQTGEALIGANVILKGTTFGFATDDQGKYEITAPEGKYTIAASYIGYESQEYDINLTNDMEVNFTLQDYEFSLSVTVISDRAKERETPVAYSDVSKKDMEFNLGSRDIPLILNTTPSVYSTVQGGGAGDARINVRGFNQRNVAIMINGVPVNDMENGWVYWSNWDGLGDATSSIQVQRGLSAVNLATPSIGGTMNIITDPTQQRAGASLKTEIGSGAFQKTTLFAHTGLVDDKFALSFGGVRKTGDGLIQRAWTDAWAYYFGAAYQVNKNNRLELYAVGAPQRHGQRSYALNAATFSHELATDLGYDPAILADPKFAEQGVLYNPNWNAVSTSYQGNQYWEEYWNVTTQERFDETYIMERENYYHKPLVNFNWYSQLSDKLSLYTTAYWSGGKGGGTGTYGSMVWDYTYQQRVANWDATIARNIANTKSLDLNFDGTPETYKVSRGILRNSVNQQWTIGAISKAFFKVNDDLTTSFGVDWRMAEIDHYREIRDLLGGDFYQDTADEFLNPAAAETYKKLGDKVDYNNTNKVSWFGAYLQGEYTADKFTFYGTAGWSMIKYDYTDHFRTAQKDASGNPIASSGKLMIETDWINGYQFKGGASFRATNDVDVYFNAGYVSKVPIFDQVIDDNTGVKLDDPKNEKFISAEVGTNVRLLRNQLTLKGNFYFTQWNDRANTIIVRNADGSDGLVRLAGIDATHMGVEFEAAYQPVRFLRLDAAASFGMWEYKNDVTGIYVSDFATGQQDTVNYYLDGLKVGDAPQTQFAGALTLVPTNGLQFQLVWKYFSNYYSNFDPFSRQDPNDREQVWEVPSYNLFDFHMQYTLPAQIAGLDVTLFGHIFNLFDELYVQDATDNSSFNAYTANDAVNGTHKADDAEIFPGLPRTFNAGFQIGF